MHHLFREDGNINWDKVDERLESGSSDADSSSDMEDSDADAETGDTRAGAIAQEIKHHYTLRMRQKLDLTGALVHFGESLTSALAAPGGGGQESDVVIEQLSSVQQTQVNIMTSFEHLREAVDQSRAVNTQLLAFLKDQTSTN
ncbi:hypothetical protein PI124_g7813 [Phytophthora idaei]|nr:hypothetical protein PI125_g8378 [Phytophthora idaei]KAG3158338.1 hypothetical protein PI126_g7904 [Phytophthora idaei]KAG3247499.1 hypothetical protein PI124_g7813 [Phytophthora idaei]